MRANATHPGRRIGCLIGSRVRDQDAEDTNVEEVIDDVHAAVGRGACGAVEGAFGEVRVRSVERGLEEVGEFVEDVRVFGRLGAVIYLKGKRGRRSVGVGLKVDERSMCED